MILTKRVASLTTCTLPRWRPSFETAIAETLHHNTRRLALSQGVYPVNIQMRELVADIDCEFTDICGQQQQSPDLYDLGDYRASQAFGVRLRWPEAREGTNGIVYDSVRKAGGTNVCVFRPSRVKLPVSQADHYEYRWDASGHVRVLKITNVEQGPNA